MIMYSYKHIAISNRGLTGRPLWEQVKIIGKSDEVPDLFILREKDLEENAYKELAEKVMKSCMEAGIPFAVNSYIQVALELGCENIHLPFKMFVERQKEWKDFTMVGVSVHSVEEAKYVWQQGGTYIIAGHIFETDCKKGVPARGLTFLKEICESVSIPVYAVGGIKRENEKLAIEAGAQGVCKMSEYMQVFQ